MIYDLGDLLSGRIHLSGQTTPTYPPQPQPQPGQPGGGTPWPGPRTTPEHLGVGSDPVAQILHHIGQAADLMASLTPGQRADLDQYLRPAPTGRHLRSVA